MTRRILSLPGILGLLVVPSIAWGGVTYSDSFKTLGTVYNAISKDSIAKKKSQHAATAAYVASVRDCHDHGYGLATEAAYTCSELQVAVGSKDLTAQDYQPISAGCNGVEAAQVQVHDALAGELELPCVDALTLVRKVIQDSGPLKMKANAKKQADAAVIAAAIEAKAQKDCDKYHRLWLGKIQITVAPFAKAVGPNVKPFLANIRSGLAKISEDAVAHGLTGSAKCWKEVADYQAYSSIVTQLVAGKTMTQICQADSMVRVKALQAEKARRGPNWHGGFTPEGDVHFAEANKITDTAQTVLTGKNLTQADCEAQRDALSEAEQFMARSLLDK